jgi:hypothetical protein
MEMLSSGSSSNSPVEVSQVVIFLRDPFTSSKNWQRPFYIFKELARNKDRQREGEEEDEEGDEDDHRESERHTNAGLEP